MRFVFHARLRPAALLAATCLLAGCGGQAGIGPPPPPTAEEIRQTEQALEAAAGAEKPAESPP